MSSATTYRPTKAVIDTAAIRHNAEQVRRYLPESTKLIAVVKADGYGHGAVQTASAAIRAGAEILAVATPDEAVKLRSEFKDINILVLGPSPVSFVQTAAKLAITLAATSAGWAEQVNALPVFQGKCKVHVKIDSGMGRIGVRTKDELLRLLEKLEDAGRFEVDGAFTHFARADEEDAGPTAEQFGKFMQLVACFREKPRLIHAANSAATLLYPEYALDAVRFGISLYGIAPSAETAEKLPFSLERAMAVETELMYVKKMPAGEQISYGGTYETTGEEWIGTLPVGYADGLKRSLTGQEVLIGGKRARIVGRICMDQCMVRLPHSFPEGEQVVLIGSQGEEEITMEEWAGRLGTIPYEIAVTFSSRIPRVYK